MLSTTFLLTALLAALILGGALTVWLWAVRRRQRVVAGGIQTLAAMRWREFSRFVIEALHAQGFETTRIEPGTQAPDADLRLNRDGQSWLLSCKQGTDSKITTAMVGELAKTVRISSADGGILATLGRIEPDARRSSKSIELLDGATLWPLIEPLLPPSLHLHLVNKAKIEAVRYTGLAWLVALAFGIVIAALLAPLIGRDAADPAPTPAAVAPASPAPSPAPSPPARQTAPVSTAEVAPVSEEEMRDAVADTVAAVADVESATWSTRSTLLIELHRDADKQLIDSICAVLERNAPLRASRLQLQPPAGSETPVRFMQCRSY